MRRHRFELPDGRRLSWYEAGQGRPLVCLHGWSISAAVFSEVAELLAADFRLLIPDLPGHGNSDPAPCCDLSSVAGDLELWLAATEERSPCLLGWSLGGMLALEMAHRRNVPIDSLVLVGATPRFTASTDWPHGLPAGQVRALSRNLNRRFEQTLAEFFALTFAGENLSEERFRQIGRFAVKKSPLPKHEVAETFLSTLVGQDQRKLLPEVLQPTLVVHGALDQVAPVAAGHSLSESLSDSRFVAFEGVGHCPFLSRPDFFAETVREFLNGAG